MATDLTPTSNTYYILYTNDLKTASTGMIAGEVGQRGDVRTPIAAINAYNSYVKFQNEWENKLGNTPLPYDPFIVPTLNGDDPNRYVPAPVTDDIAPPS